MAKTIRVQPIYGKFVSVTSNGRTIKIWLVDPYTLEQGTEVSIEDAIQLLALRNPVVCPAQVKDENGKFVQWLTDEEKEQIKELNKQICNKLSANTLQEITVSKPDTSAMEQLVKTQAQLIETQTKQLEEMQKNFIELQNNVSKLLKKK